MRPTTTSSGPASAEGMRATVALGVVGLCGVVAYLVGMAGGFPLWSLAAKPLPVLCLALVVLGRTGAFSRLVGGGLALSAVADLGIEWSFVLGLLLFLLAHLAYTAAFLTHRPPLRLLRSLPVALAI